MDITDQIRDIHFCIGEDAISVANNQRLTKKLSPRSDLLYSMGVLDVHGKDFEIQKLAYIRKRTLQPDTVRFVLREGCDPDQAHTLRQAKDVELCIQFKPNKRLQEHYRLAGEELEGMPIKLQGVQLCSQVECAEGSVKRGEFNFQSVPIEDNVFTISAAGADLSRADGQWVRFEDLTKIHKLDLYTAFVIRPRIQLHYTIEYTLSEVAVLLDELLRMQVFELRDWPTPFYQRYFVGGACCYGPYFDGEARKADLRGRVYVPDPATPLPAFRVTFLQADDWSEFWRMARGGEDVSVANAEIQLSGSEPTSIECPPGEHKIVLEMEGVDWDWAQIEFNPAEGKPRDRRDIVITPSEERKPLKWR